MKYIPPKRPISEPASTPKSGAAPPKSLILYVEDDPVNQQVARARLSKKYEVLIAPSDRDACQLLIEHGEKLMVVLMDIELKGSRLNGIDLTRLFRGKLDAQQRPPFAQSVPCVEAPILFVTAYGQRFSHTELLAAGADAVIHKPIDFVELQAAMTRTYLSGHRR